jgi:hypothetical protein
MGKTKNAGVQKNIAFLRYIFRIGYSGLLSISHAHAGESLE